MRPDDPKSISKDIGIKEITYNPCFLIWENISHGNGGMRCSLHSHWLGGTPPPSPWHGIRWGVRNNFIGRNRFSTNKITGIEFPCLLWEGSWRPDTGTSTSLREKSPGQWRTTIRQNHSLRRTGKYRAQLLPHETGVLTHSLRLLRFLTFYPIPASYIYV